MSKTSPQNRSTNSPSPTLKPGKFRMSNPMLATSSPLNSPKSPPPPPSTPSPQGSPGTPTSSSRKVNVKHHAKSALARENDKLRHELEREKANRRILETRLHSLQGDLHTLQDKLNQYEVHGSSLSGPEKSAIGGFSFLKSIPLFQTLSEAQLSKLSASLETRRFQDGDVIIKQGDPGHTFYVVESGEVVVTRTGDKASNNVLMTLGPGDYFGERALLTEEVRAATCTAKGDILCQVLVRETFTEALSGVENLLGERLRQYEHDLNEASVQRLESHVRLFAEALHDLRSGGNVDELFDDNGTRRVSSSESVGVKRARLILNILENVNPESDIKGMIFQIQENLASAIKCAVCVYLNRADVMGEGGLGESMDLLDNGTEFCKFIAEETVEREVSLTSCERAVTSQNETDLEVFEVEPGDGGEEVAFVACPIVYEGLVQAVIVAHRNLRAGEVHADEYAMVSGVANHVGRMFADENENVSIRSVIGEVRDINSCDLDLGITINAVRNMPIDEWGDVREVSLRMGVRHGISAVAMSLESDSYPVTMLDHRLVNGEESALQDQEREERRSEDGRYGGLLYGVADFEGATGSLSIKMKDLPLAAKLVMTLHDSKNHRILAHVIVPLFSDDKTISSFASEELYFVNGEPDQNWRVSKSVGKVGTCASVSFEYGRIDLVGTKRHTSIGYKHIDGATDNTGDKKIRQQKRNSLAQKAARRGSVTKRRRSTVSGGGTAPLHAQKTTLSEDVKKIVNRDILNELTDEEKSQIWQSRKQLTKFPSALPTLLSACDYGNRSQVLEAEALMEEWEETSNPLDALQLLDVRYASPKVREYAVRMLNIMTDEELSEIMLQLVQVLKFEPHYDTALCRFLLRRALLNPFVCGHTLFWMLQSERHINDVRHHCRVLLELYLRNCGSHRVSLGHQMFIVNRLEEVAQIVKKGDPSSRNELLREELKKIVFPKSFQLPLDPYKTCRGIVVNKCRVMSSKKLPLWLTFVREDPWEPNFVVLFKSGDDLRQDQLTLQILRVMDRLWKDEGLDLAISPYRCCATGVDQGMLEVVQESATLAGITCSGIGDSTTGISKKIAITQETMKGRGSIEKWLYRWNGSGDFTRPAIEAPGTDKTEGKVLVDFQNHKKIKEMFDGFEVKSREPTRMHDTTEDRKYEFVNPLQQGTQMYQALENFTMSCAGYAVATYVLGIGDRHNDNVMMTKDGKLFHIDFGHFLGNFKTKYGYKRERAPFVFTQHMAQVLGGRRVGERYRKFEDFSGTAFNLLRRHTNTILVLFNLMVGCGIPELQNSYDLMWIRNAMKVEETDDEAHDRFIKLIHESLKCQTTRIMHLIHILKNN